MGKEYFKRPVGFSGGLAEPVETFTLSTVTRTLSPKGVSFLTYASSGGSRDALLPKPSFPGQVKEIFLIKNTSSEEAQIHAPSTANVFAGTTYNQVTVAATTVAPAGTAYLRCVARTSTNWAITVGSTIDWDFAATTGSTAQA